MEKRILEAMSSGNLFSIVKLQEYLNVFRSEEALKLFRTILKLQDQGTLREYAFQLDSSNARVGSVFYALPKQ